MATRLTEQQLSTAEQGASYEVETLCAEIRACWAERGKLASRVAALQADKLNLSAVVKTLRRRDTRHARATPNTTTDTE